MTSTAALRYKTVELRFYGDLVDFIPGRRRTVERTFDVAPSIKDMIEACGVPHPEIDLVLVKGEPVGWDRSVADGDHISVYPRFRTFDVSGLSPVHVDPPGELRFALDVHLGRLARYLRLLGLDAIVPDDPDDARLAELAANDGRVLLTRDVELLKRTIIQHGYFVRAIDPLLQCIEVVRYFDASAALAPFTRCMACNGLIEPAARDDVEPHIPSGVRHRHDSFRRCSSCGRVYWEGTHVDRLENIVSTVVHHAAAAARLGA